MKKIVGIIAAVAMAASVFAADVSAKVEILGRLFNYDGDNIGSLAIAEGNRNWNPVFQMQVSGDKAGAKVAFNDKKSGGEVKSINYSIWFKPADILKFNIGEFATELNQEKIDWCQTETKIEGNGVALNIASNGLTFDLFFNTGWTDGNWDQVTDTNPVHYWMKKDKDQKAVVGETYFKFGYAADFGSITAYFDAQNTFKLLEFGAGYANTFGSVNMFVNALATINTDNDDSFGRFRGELFASTNVDAFGISAFIAGEYQGKNPAGLSWWRIADNTQKPEKALVGASLKLTYGLDGFTPYLYIKDVDFLADKFGMELKPGVTFNVGTCAFDIALDMNLGEKFTLDVPVGMTVAF